MPPKRGAAAKKRGAAARAANVDENASAASTSTRRASKRAKTAQEEPQQTTDVTANDSVSAVDNVPEEKAGRKDAASEEMNGPNSNQIDAPVADDSQAVANPDAMEGGHDSGDDKGGDGDDNLEHVKEDTDAMTVRAHKLTVESVENDPLTKLAKQTWKKKGWQFSRSVVQTIMEDLEGSFKANRLVILDLNTCLEECLWPGMSSDASDDHVLLACALLNEKARDSLSPWETCTQDAEKFQSFFSKVLSLANNQALRPAQQQVHLLFLVHVFQGLENEIVRKQCLRLLTLPLWSNIHDGRVKQAIKEDSGLEKPWKRFLKKSGKADPSRPEVTFIPAIFERFFQNLDSVAAAIASSDEKKSSAGRQILKCCERFLEWVCDLLCQLPTRRFFLSFVEDTALIERVSRSPVVTDKAGRLLAQLLQLTRYYTEFAVDQHTGRQLTENESNNIHYLRIAVLQRVLFNRYKDDYPEFIFSNVQGVDSEEDLAQLFASMPRDHLRAVASALRLCAEDVAFSDETIRDLLVRYHARREWQLAALNNVPLYPDELTLWDRNLVPDSHHDSDEVLALPKLNMQFLTFHDYLIRNFNLYRLESTYQIRQDIEDIMRLLAPRKDPTGHTVFQGWAKMALPAINFQIREVSKPHLGEELPAYVLADFKINVESLRDGRARNEWLSLREHDVLFLVVGGASIPVGKKLADWKPFKNRRGGRDVSGVQYLRGCEVLGFLNEDGKVISQSEREMQLRESGQRQRGVQRRIRVMLDPAQFQADQIVKSKTGEWPYDNIQMVVRRRSEENNFKAVLECIRDIANSEISIPVWLRDIILGYGDPRAAHYSRLSDRITSFDFCDTFISDKHLKDSFPNAAVTLNGCSGTRFQVSFGGTHDAVEIQATSNAAPVTSPYPVTERRNTVPFTPVQVEAIHSAMNVGMTLIIGPPGTGKTDVAVQAISNLYHNFPGQRILLITHSNHALNDLFEKIMQLDIDEKHLLRLGRGEEGLKTSKDFSKWGRVQHMLDMRMQLLMKVGKLAMAMGMDPTGPQASCEAAAHFYLIHVLAKWEVYEAEFAGQDSIDCANVSSKFPFTEFFDDLEPIFKGENAKEDFEQAQLCFTYIKSIFDDLEDAKAFETMRSYSERSKYLVTTQAKIIAMTCTHAALKRHEFIKQGFEFDTIIMEEAAQVLEVETFVPLMLQQQESSSRLKRLVMLGDHNQLPPVVQNTAMQKFSRLDQSMFARLVRLGVSTVQLDMQGRARPELAKLYNWRYEALGDLEAVSCNKEYTLANAGMAHTFQFVDVQDFFGEGETSPRPYFYQNLGEAEMMVATYMYLRLLGHSANSIVMLTTYNGQKQLLRDIVESKCARSPSFGRPACIDTVDKFQGQQSDIVLLSLVRTKAVGHLRDVRRLVVATSRARLGLYVFGRMSLFKDTWELRHTFRHLQSKPTQLELIPNERFPTQRSAGEQVKDGVVKVDSVQSLQQTVNDVAIATGNFSG